MLTREVHKLVKHIISKYEGLELINFKTRRTVSWQVPLTIPNRDSINIRAVEYNVAFKDKDIFYKALDELNVYLLLKSYPRKIEPKLKWWRSEATFQVYATIK